MPLLWEAYCNLTMRANWLSPKADAEAALNIIQERFQRAESGRRLRHQGEQQIEEHRWGRGEGRDEEGKVESYYFYHRRVMLLCKAFLHITSLSRKPPHQEDPPQSSERPQDTVATTDVN